MNLLRKLKKNQKRMIIQVKMMNDASSDETSNDKSDTEEESSKTDTDNSSSSKKNKSLFLMIFIIITILISRCIIVPRLLKKDEINEALKEEYSSYYNGDID